MNKKYGKGLPELKHWQGNYALPRPARNWIKRRIEPLAHRPRLIMAVYTLMMVIGRWHAAPGTFDQRGCGLGQGFALDRRALSGPKRPPGCDGLTEALVRDATAFLIEMGFIERITPRAEYRMNRDGHWGRWLRATKDKKSQTIRAPAVRFRLTGVLRSIFSKTLGRSEAPKVPSLQQPVCENTLLTISESPNERCDGIHTVRNQFLDIRTPVQWLALNREIQAERVAAAAPESKLSFLAELAARKARREGGNGLDLPF